MRNSPSRGAGADRPHLVVESGLRIHLWAGYFWVGLDTLGDCNEETSQSNVTKLQTDGTTCNVVLNGRQEEPPATAHRTKKGNVWGGLTRGKKRSVLCVACVVLPNHQLTRARERASSLIFMLLLLPSDGVGKRGSSME